MPKVQQTFTLIDPAVQMQGLINRRQDQALPELAPWMTSKQAQKLHRERTKQPRVSRAEQRRLELEEQARIKAEFEKEKASKRARFLRDKKKEKEQKALELKRKKGLPLVDVRPSQSTISWFVRPGTKRKVDDVEDAVEEQSAPKPHPSQRVRQQQSSENVPPAHLRGPSAPPVVPVIPAAPKTFPQTDPLATLLPASSQLTPLRDVTNIATSAPPASTQFLIEHLEDFLPTPSQMDRELEEEYKTPMVVTKPSSATTASRPRPPVPLFNDSSKGKASTFTPPAPRPLAPLPAPGPTSKLGSRIKNTADFFCTQDWELSSQDIRDLEGTTTTPCKHSKPQAPMAALQPVIKTIENPQPQDEDSAAYVDEPPILAVSTREARRRTPDDFAPLHDSQQSVWDSESQSDSQPSLAPRPGTRKSQHSPPPPEPSLPKLQAQGSPKSRAAAAPESAKKTPAPKDVPHKTSSPKQFLRSSSDGPDLLMALVESRRLAAEEEAKRQAAERKRLAEERLAEEQLAKELAREKRKQLQTQAKSHVEGTTTRLPAPLSKFSIQNGDSKGPAPMENGTLHPQAGAEEAVNAPGLYVAASEAETNYGDDDFDELEEETLIMLEAVATTTIPTTTTTTVAAAAAATAFRATPLVPAQNGAGGNPANNTASFDLNDDSWLANDKELDFSKASNTVKNNASFSLEDDSWLSDDETMSF